jgi:CheY-like chemotaxis protein
VSIKGARIIVADDQPDVARTLTAPLRAAGAALQFVSDGEQALELIGAGGVDLLIADMKMPPNDWGGLWLLQQLQMQHIQMPTLVLSGEGQQRQTIEAMRFGAKDWVSKSRADTELVSHCTSVLEAVLSKAVEAMATGGPSPLAYGYARYQRAVGGELQYPEGLRLLEEILRFVTLIGLASTDGGGDGFRRLRPEQLARPSFGTWLAAIRELRGLGAGSLFASLSRHLMPEGDKKFHAITQLRNDHSHGGGDADAADRELVFQTIEVCAHRFLSTPFAIGSHAQMRYVNNRLEVSLKEYRGASAPRSAEVTLTEPQFLNSPDPYLFAANHAPINLEPWLCVFDPDDQGVPTLGVFDGLKTAKPNNVAPDDVLLYTDPALGERRKQRSDRVARWADVAGLFATDVQSV